MMRGTGLAAGGKAPFELFDEAGERLAAVREAVLFDGVEFGRGDAALGQEEQRVVAEAAVTAVVVDDRAVPFAFGDDRLRVVGVADEDDQRNEVRTPIGLSGEVGEQLFVVARIGFGFAGVARRIDARRAAEAILPYLSADPR